MNTKFNFSRILSRLIIFLLAVCFSTCNKPIDIRLTISTPSIKFGIVSIGQNLDHSCTIRNSSTSTANLTGSVILNGSGFSIISGDGSFDLAPGDSIKVTIIFAPTSATGYSGSLKITHNATNQSSPTTVTLSGTGQIPKSIVISVSQEFISFDKVTIGQTLDKSLIISNSSSSNSNLEGIVSINETGFSIVSGGGSLTLSPGQSRTVTIRFSPTSSTSYSGSLKIEHNGTDIISPQVVPLSGIGQNTLILISVSPTPINFGAVTVAQKKEQNVTISNSSSSNSNLEGNVSINGTGFSIVSGGGSLNLAPGQSKIVTVLFSPTSITSYLGSISITHNATNTSSPSSVTLSGSGQVEPSVFLSVDSVQIRFEPVVINDILNRYFTISNSSTSNGNLVCNISITGIGFSLLNGDFTLAPGQSKTLGIRFSPTSVRSYSGSEFTVLGSRLVALRSSYFLR